MSLQLTEKRQTKVTIQRMGMIPLGEKKTKQVLAFPVSDYTEGY